MGCRYNGAVEGVEHASTDLLAGSSNSRVVVAGPCSDDANAAATIESERAPVTSSTAAAEFGNGCRICFDAVETEVLIPCGHKGACKQCIETIVREGYESARKVPLCPVCRCVLIGPYCVTPYEM